MSGGKNIIRHEPDNGRQPHVVYWVEKKRETWRAAFSTEAQAQAWIDRYGDRPPQGPG